MRKARMGETLFGASLLGAGLFAIYKASALPFGSLREPDSGLFPVAVTVAFTLLAALSLAAPPLEGGSAPDRAGMKRVLVLIGALVAYALLLPRAGFIVCTVALLALVLRGLGRVGWIGTAISSAVTTIGCYYLFTRLGLPLPSGLIGF
jgi:putative tricarboxylic transport membrane protein